MADKAIIPTDPDDTPEADTKGPAETERRTQGFRGKFRKLGRKSMRRRFRR